MVSVDVKHHVYLLTFDAEVTFVTVAKAPLLASRQILVGVASPNTGLRHQTGGASPNAGLRHQAWGRVIKGVVASRGVESPKVGLRNLWWGYVSKRRVASPKAGLRQAAEQHLRVKRRRQKLGNQQNNT